MPFVDLSIQNASPSPAAQQAVRAGLTRLMADVLRKRADLTVVAITVHAAGGLAVGGIDLAPGRWSGRLVAYVTEGTNTDAEKAQFLDEAYRLLSTHLPAPASPFYIVVQELPAGAWGYDGQSQAGRARTPVAA